LSSIPVSAVAGGGDLVERRFQLLALDVHIRTNCPVLDRKLDYLVQDARQDYPVSATLDIEAILEDGCYRIAGAGESPLAYDAALVVSHLYRVCYRKAYAALPPSGALIHAACAGYGGRRFLLIGDSGAGKTTLVIRLAREGAEVEVDELALLLPEGVVGLPRRFHVKEEGLATLPWVAAQVAKMPRWENGDGSVVYGFAPSEWGHPWHIRHAPLDAVFFLEPNHGGQSRLVEVPRYEMIRLAIDRLRVLDKGQRGWVAEICRQFDAAVCYKLVVGGLDSTVALLLSKLQGLPAANG
jgi:hypothetical protein